MKDVVMSVAERLVSNSTLTKIQLETLELQKRVLSGEISLSQAAELRRRGPVSVGSYYRVLGQAKGKVRASILTVLAAMWLGYVKFDDLARLFELIGRGPAELRPEDSERMVSLLDALLDRIVT
jgi:hypothetical protein